MIAQNLQIIQKALYTNTKLVAVSKFHSANAILEAYHCGQRIFGESRAQELVGKATTLPHDIEWHFIGHLQTNKLKQILPIVHLIHSVDTPHLLQEINEVAKKMGLTTNVLLQVHIAKEKTKYGFTAEELQKYLSEGSWRNLSNINLCGIMGMATNCDDNQEIRKEFRTLHHLFTKIKELYFSNNDTFKELSMGMTSDYKIAEEEGSTIVRIGTAIFGERDY